MSVRVSHGACVRCGRPVLYQGAAYCSPQCQALPSRDAFSLDSETELFRPGKMIPKLACVSWQTSTEKGLVHAQEAREHVVRLLESDALISGYNIAYDMSVFCGEWPELVPLIFEVYRADRVTDTMLREKLNDIAKGTYRKFGELDGNAIKLNYDLEDVALRRCGMKLTKGGWQLRFGELIDVPMSFWPAEAQTYAVADAVANRAVWRDQELEESQRPENYFKDEFRQSRAAFWLQLMSAWGFHTDPESVREFARKTQQKYEELRDELVHAGVVRIKKTKKKATGLVEIEFVKNTKVVKDLVVGEKTSKGQRVPLTKEAEKKLVLLREALESEPVPARRNSLIRRIQKAEESVNIAKDVTSRADHPLLKKYAEFNHYDHMLSTDVPLLQLGTQTPIHARFDLADTGRTTSKPNVQNWSTSNGMRECVEPRPGTIFAIGDYSGFELRTWSQVCLWMFGQTRMGEMLNKGLDPHLEIAALILKIPYSEAKYDFELDPKGRVYLPRQTGKVTNFGSPGGLGPDRLVDYARLSYGVIITREEAVDLQHHWQMAWPEAPLYKKAGTRFMNSGEKQAIQFASERVRGWLYPKYTEYLNTFFQGLAADAAKAAGFLIAQACYADQHSPLYGCRITNFVHDEFIVEVPDDAYAHERAIELARLMIVGASPFLPDVPPVVEPLLARKWSKAAKPVHDANGRLVPWVPKVKVAA